MLAKREMVMIWAGMTLTGPTAGGRLHRLETDRYSMWRELGYRVYLVDIVQA